MIHFWNEASSYTDMRKSSITYVGIGIEVLVHGGVYVCYGFKH